MKTNRTEIEAEISRLKSIIREKDSSNSLAIFTGIVALVAATAGGLTGYMGIKLAQDLKQPHVCTIESAISWKGLSMEVELASLKAKKVAIERWGFTDREPERKQYTDLCTKIGALEQTVAERNKYQVRQVNQNHVYTQDTNVWIWVNPDYVTPQ